ncbi:MAG: beta-ketoacyl synthase chain length factor [Pseudomonadales bacterium]|nr:beta-ketoacyl synthase chain length factor [Pseudomonadales bacterium]MCP5184442.1 beta-ketoacyl synthase chain length factor [Pseudomonadales bacterium]
MKFTILGMGIWGRGLQGAGALGEVVRGASAIVPETEFVAPRPAAIPAREQRRAGLLVNLAVMVAHEACENAGVDKTLVPSVFASALGDTDVTDYMCRKLTQTEKLLSPTRFHNSVHNAAAGYWSISAANHAPSTFVGGFVNSVGAGLLEAVTQARAFGQPTLLVCYDIANRQPFADLLPVGESLACALVIGGEAGEQAASQAGIDCELAYVDGQTSPTPPSTPALAQLASANPVGQALSLCEAVVRVCGPGFAGERTLWISATPSASLRIVLRKPS